MSENLAQQRFAEGVKVYQVHRSARSLGQLVHQCLFLTGREAMSGVYGQVQIAVCQLLADSQRSVQDRLQRHMVNDGRPLPAIELDQLQNRSKLYEWISALANQADREKPEPFALNSFTMVGHSGRNHDIESRIPCSTSDIEAMGPEIPIFGDQKEKTGASAHSRSSQA
jgi:hypothetical protein